MTDTLPTELETRDVAPVEPISQPPPPSRFQVARALSRTEARRMASSPLVIVGIAMTLILAWAVTGGSAPDENEWLDYTSRLFPLFLYPLCGMVLFAANRATLRPKRDKTDELFESLPADRATRSTALLLALRGPVLVGLVATGVLAVASWLGPGKDEGDLLRGTSIQPPITEMEIAPVLTAILLVACAGALGVLLARLLPWGLVPIAALIVIALVTARLGGAELQVSALSPYLSPPALPSFLSPFPAWAHLVYVLGLGLFAVGLLFWADGARTWAIRCLAVATVIGLAGIAWQSQSIDDDTADRIAALTAVPADQHCVERDGIEYCTFADFAGWEDSWAPIVEGVRDAAPNDIRSRPLTVSQRVSAAEVGRLLPAIRERALAEPRQPTPENTVELDLRWGSSEVEAYLAVMVGNWAVGLPTGPGRDDQPCYVGGQARAVAALVLAGTSSPEEVGFLLNTHVTYDGAYGEHEQWDDDFRYADMRPTSWVSDHDVLVVYDTADLALAQTMLELPDDEARQVVASEWDRWIDPDTTSAELADELGLEVDEAGPGPEGLEPCA